MEKHKVKRNRRYPILMSEDEHIDWNQHAEFEGLSNTVAWLRYVVAKHCMEIQEPYFKWLKQRQKKRKNK